MDMGALLRAIDLLPIEEAEVGAMVVAEDMAEEVAAVVMEGAEARRFHSWFEIWVKFDEIICPYNVERN